MSEPKYADPAVAHNTGYAAVMRRLLAALDAESAAHAETRRERDALNRTAIEQADTIVACARREADWRLLLREVRDVLREPMNGYHKCLARGCLASKENDWRHDDLCPTDAQARKVAWGRAAIDAALHPDHDAALKAAP